MERRDGSRHCAFHRDYEHTLNECPSLREQVEAMIRKGILQEYVVTGNAAKEEAKTAPEGARNAPAMQGTRDILAIHKRPHPGKEAEARLKSEIKQAEKIRRIFQRRFASERNQIIGDKVDRLLEVGFIRDVWCPTWISNVVVVKKKNGKWRVCIDFTNLNKACPKDCYPLPKIDQLVDATAGYERLSFLDAYSGYNQIPVAAEDQDKTAFITEKGLYCYTVMPFGLKNAGATYQRLVNRMFKKQLGKTMEVYIDDMVVKTKVRRNHEKDLGETFEILRRYGMRLNPAKCAFGVSSGQFLGHIVSRRGIEPNPEKVDALRNMAEPTSKKEIQVLTGLITALSRFISRMTDRCKPFFDALRSKDSVIWGEPQHKAFQQLKDYLASGKLLSVPIDGEPLFLYPRRDHNSRERSTVQRRRGSPAHSSPHKQEHD
ncbi:hypothetical protein M0R45_009546 [Rubus argutus]|uniref:Reverse transcriptase domain-containing protein n=1 Tax=Rubus argutus TaxID=59490 RepID=A0AAW1Y4Q8_RUBAR